MFPSDKMELKLWIFTSFISYILPSLAQEKQCYVPSYPYFSTKTPYHISRGSEMTVPDGCSPIHLWVIIRHGTRYPYKGDISAESIQMLYKLKDKIISNHKEGRGKLCEADLKNLEHWNYNVTEEQQDMLTLQGKKDLAFLAKNFKTAFPSLLTASKESYIFQSAMSQRTKDSAIAFTNELLGTNFETTEGNNVTENEEFLHTINHCSKYQTEVYRNDSTYREFHLFKESLIVQELKLNISKYLGFKQILSYDLIALMYWSCAYENAWYINSKPPFCAVFLSEHLKIFEYIDDMIHYYKRGYGRNMNLKFGCVIGQNMINSLTRAINNYNSYKATILFTHGETISPLIARLGLNKDEVPLRHDNYEKMGDRKWRLAFFGNFAANLAAVLHKCHTEQGEKNIVMFYENERQVVPPNCTNNPCTLEDLQNNFPEVLDETNCNTNFCKDEAVNKSNRKYINANVVLTFTILMCTSITLG